MKHVGPAGVISLRAYSSDIGDTAMCIQMKMAGEILIRDIDCS
jgi:adenylosuccinate lyase